MLTKQEIFDKSVMAMLAQRRGSSGPVGCVYAQSETCRCGIGALLPYEVAKRWDSYNEDGFGINTTPEDLLTAEQHANVILDLRDAGIEYAEHLALLTDLQSAHDACSDFYGDEFVERYKRHAKLVAETHKLSAAVLD